MGLEYDTKIVWWAGSWIYGDVWKIIEYLLGMYEWVGEASISLLYGKRAAFV